MLRLFWLLTLSLSGYLCLGQQVQVNRSAINRHLKLNDYDSAAYLLSQAASAFYEQKENDSAIHYNRKALLLATKIRNEQLVPWIQNALGSAFRYNGTTDSAFYYYNKSLEYYQSARDTAQILIVTSNIATALKEIGLYPEAIDRCIESLLITKGSSPSRTLASIYNTMASCYREAEEYSLAFQYYRMGLAVRKHLSLSAQIAQSYNNIGETHLDVRQYDSALFYLSRALALKKQVTNKNAWSSTLDLIGKTYVALNAWDSANKYLTEAIIINKTVSDQHVKADVFNSVAELKLKTNDLKQARLYLDSAEALATGTGSGRHLATTLELKMRLERKENNLKSALAIADRLSILNDSLFNVERYRALLGAEPRYQSEKKEREITALKETTSALQSEIEAKETFIFYFTLAMILVLIIIALAVFNIITVRKNKRRIETLLRELHHRVKNNLQILSSLLMLQSQELTDEKAKQAVKTSEGRVNAMALIHKKLYSDKENHEINFREYVTELVAYLVQTYGYTQKEMELILDIEELNIDVDKAIPLGLIINELVSNAFKHAYVGVDNPELKIKLNLHREKELALSICDNGRIHSPKELNRSDSFGLKMVRLLTKELRGKLEITHNNGTGFHLQIPYSL